MNEQKNQLKTSGKNIKAIIFKDKRISELDDWQETYWQLILA